MGSQGEKNSEEEILFLKTGAMGEKIKNEILKFSKEKKILVCGATLRTKENFINHIIDASVWGKYDTLYVDDGKNLGFATFIKHEDSIEIFFAFHNSRELFLSRELFFRALNIIKNKYNCNKFWFSMCPRENFEKYRKFIISYVGFSENKKDRKFELEI